MNETEMNTIDMKWAGLDDFQDDLDFPPSTSEISASMALKNIKPDAALWQRKHCPEAWKANLPVHYVYNKPTGLGLLFKKDAEFTYCFIERRTEVSSINNDDSPLETLPPELSAGKKKHKQTSSKNDPTVEYISYSNTKVYSYQRHKPYKSIQDVKKIVDTIALPQLSTLSDKLGILQSKYENIQSIRGDNMYTKNDLSELSKIDQRFRIDMKNTFKDVWKKAFVSECENKFSTHPQLAAAFKIVTGIDSSAKGAFKFKRLFIDSTSRVLLTKGSESEKASSTEAAPTTASMVNRIVRTAAEGGGCVTEIERKLRDQIREFRAIGGSLDIAGLEATNAVDEFKSSPVLDKRGDEACAAKILRERLKKLCFHIDIFEYVLEALRGGVTTEEIMELVNKARERQQGSDPVLTMYGRPKAVDSLFRCDLKTIVLKSSSVVPPIISLTTSRNTSTISSASSSSSSSSSRRSITEVFDEAFFKELQMLLFPSSEIRLIERYENKHLLQVLGVFVQKKNTSRKKRKRVSTSGDPSEGRNTRANTTSTPVVGTL